MAEKKRIAFLFGAGAERCLGLPGGYDYLIDSFFCRKTKDIKEPLKKFFSETYFQNKSFPYKLSKDVLSCNYISILKRIAKLAIDHGKLSTTILTRESIDTWKQDTPIVLEFKTLVENYKDGKDLVIQDDILEHIVESGKPTREEFTDILKPGLAGILDNYFHTIVNPQKFGPNNFAKIFYFYWSCYFSITDCLVLNNQDFFREYLKGDAVNYTYILENFRRFLERINSFTKCAVENEKNYYKLIAESVTDDFSITGVITTNYLNLVRNAFSNITENISYPNGHFDLYEFPEYLEITDLAKSNQIIDNKKIFFPFIFGQSYVKPVVCSKQIKEFDLLSEIFNLNSTYEEKSILVILGYEINPDDNHINAFIHEYIENGNRLVFVTDKKSKFENSISNLYLHDDSNCENLIVNFNDDMENIVSKIFEKLKSM